MNWPKEAEAVEAAVGLMMPNIALWDEKEERNEKEEREGAKVSVGAVSRISKDSEAGKRRTSRSGWEHHSNRRWIRSG